MKAKSRHNMMKSRTLAFLLIFTMCAWLWPWNLMEVQAATAIELKNPRVTVNSSGDVEKATWDCVWFGNYKQSSDGNGDFKREPIKWRVLSVNGNDVFLLADQNLDHQQYNETQTDVTWGTCTLRSWLNGYDGTKNDLRKDYSSENFIDEAFSLDEQKAIHTTNVVNWNNPSYGTLGGNDTTDRISLLSIEEVEKTSYGFSSNYDTEDVGRRAQDTDYAKKRTHFEGIWHLRSPGGDSAHAASVNHFGTVYYNGNSVSGFSEEFFNAVRPTLHLNLESDLWSYAGTVSTDGTVDEVEPVLQNPETASNGTTTWDCIWFGNYKQSSDGNGGFKREPIKWRVLSVSGNDAFLIADQNLNRRKYNEENAPVTWETCTLRSWLNGYNGTKNAYGKDYSGENFIDEAFSPDEQKVIQATNVVNGDNPSYGAAGGNDTIDQIYLLSIEEATKTAYGFVSNYDTYDAGRCAKNTDYAKERGAWTSDSDEYKGNGVWWLRSPGNTSDYVTLVHSQGAANNYGYNVYTGGFTVRPVLHLNLKSDLWSDAGTVSSDGKKAEKAPTYKVSYDANGGTGAPAAQTKTYDEILPLSSAIPTRTGYDFLGWSENKATSTATYAAGSSYTKNANATLYAVWKERPKGGGNQNQGSGSDANDQDKQNNTQQAGQTANEQKGKLTQTISASSKTLTYKGKSVSLNAETDGDGKLSYSNSNKKIVTVSASGTVTPKECGNAKITVKASETEKYKAGKTTITVKVALKKPGLRLKVIGRSSVKLSWSKVPGASGYKVYSRNTKQKKYRCAITKKAKQRSAIHRNLKRGRIYSYKVRAYRKVGKKIVYGPYSQVSKAWRY